MIGGLTGPLPIIATLYLPDLNPLSRWSLFALLVPLVLMMVTRERKLAVSQRRQRILLAAPFLLILLSCLFHGGAFYLLQGRSFPNA